MIVADTHSWLWWISNRKLLSSSARQAFENETIAVSPMMFWEVAMHAHRERIRLDAPTLPWLKDAVELIGLYTASPGAKFVADRAKRVRPRTASMPVKKMR